MIGGAFLYRERYYVACLLVGLFLGVGFDLAHHYGGVVIRFLLHAVHDYVARFFAGHAGYALQLALLLVVQRLRLGFEPGDVLLLVVQRAFAAFDCLGLFVQRVLALNQTAVGALQLVAAVSDLFIQLGALAQHGFLGGQHHFLALSLGLLGRFVEQFLRGSLRAAYLFLSGVFAVEIAEGNTRSSAYQQCHNY